MLDDIAATAKGIFADAEPLRNDFEPVGKAIVENACGPFEAHPTRALACSLLVAALGLASASGCTGGGGTVADAGEQPVNYTFDHGTEGWFLNKRVGSSFTNLGAGVPDAGVPDRGSPPTLSFAESDGDPSPGSLRLTVAFTAPRQYVAAGVVLGQARDLSGKTLHARVRLVSGPAAGVWADFYACDPGCTDLAMRIDAAELTGDAWTPLASSVQAAQLTVGPPNVDDFSSVLELGIDVWSNGGTADGGAPVSTGDLVFEIDTVTN